MRYTSIDKIQKDFFIDSHGDYVNYTIQTFLYMLSDVRPLWRNGDDTGSYLSVHAHVTYITYACVMLCYI